MHLSAYNNFNAQVYSIANDGLTNVSNLGLILSGYDFPSVQNLEFRSQIGYDFTVNTFEIVVSLMNNQTRFYSINYFIIVITSEGSAFVNIVTSCNNYKI